MPSPAVARREIIQVALAALAYPTFRSSPALADATTLKADNLAMAAPAVSFIDEKILQDNHLTGTGTETGVKGITLNEFLATPGTNGAVVNFWFPECAFCRTEMPDLNGLSGRLESTGIKVIALSTQRINRNIGELFGKITDFNRQYNITKIPPRILRGQPEIMKFLKARNSSALSSDGFAQPLTLVVDKSGIVKLAVESYRTDWNTAAMAECIRDMVVPRRGPQIALAGPTP